MQKGDYATAFKILEPLAKKGDATAQHNLAVLYQDGLGTKADAKQALHWYEKAAAQGEPEAQFMAGLMYSDGIGTAQDYKKAAQWYEKAAQKGHAEAQNNLAARYDHRHRRNPRHGKSQSIGMAKPPRKATNKPPTHSNSLKHWRKTTAA